jgi:hypothetical protein
MPCSRSWVAKSLGERATSLVTPTTRDPCSKAPQISKVAASKEQFEAERPDQKALTSRSFVFNTKLFTARCDMQTHLLASPVDPEV